MAKEQFNRTWTGKRVDTPAEKQLRNAVNPLVNRSGTPSGLNEIKNKIKEIQGLGKITKKKLTEFGVNPNIAKLLVS